MYCIRNGEEIREDAWDYRNDLMSQECRFPAGYKERVENLRTQDLRAKCLPQLHSGGGKFLRTNAEYDGAVED